MRVAHLRNRYIGQHCELPIRRDGLMRLAYPARCLRSRTDVMRELFASQYTVFPNAHEFRASLLDIIPYLVCITWREYDIEQGGNLAIV